jgi:two-component system sensor histidine kinase ChiS
MQLAVPQELEPDDAPRSRRRPRAALNAWAINVLLVEDDPADSAIVLDVLNRHPNVAAASAFNAPDTALFHLATGKYRPDLILLDIMMPKVDGFKFLDALQRISSVRDTPVVMLTTSRFMRDVEQARVSAACGYIVKPDSYGELKARLDSAVKQAISGKWSF